MEKTSSIARKDGRRPLLVYLAPEIIRDLKKVALDQDCHAYEIAETALKAWLKTNSLARPKT